MAATSKGLDRRNRELSILNTIARELNRSVNLDGALNTVLAQIAELLNLETGWIWLLNEQTGEPHLAASQNLPSGLIENPDLMEGWCYCLDTYRKGNLKGAANVNVVTCSRLNKLVHGTEGLRYHASIPLYTQDRRKLGVLNVASTTWRELSSEDLRILNTAGDLLGIAIERARFFAQLQEAKQRVIDAMEKELQVAHDMQMDLLPKMPPRVESMDLSGICIPANHVGGDYYNFLHLNEAQTKLGIVIADVSGKAMQAATVAMRFNEMLRYETIARTSPVEILKGLDGSLRGRIPPEMFVTAGIGVLDVASRSLNFASAANPEVYHFSGKNGTVHPLTVRGFPLGLPLILEATEPFQSVNLDLDPGDVIVFTSDGIEEAQDSDGDFYGGQRLSECLHNSVHKQASAEAIRDEIVADVTRFIGEAPQTDDLTVVVLRSLQ